MLVSVSETAIMSTLHPYSATGLKMKELLYNNKISTDIYIVDNGSQYQTRYATACGITIEVPVISDPSVKDGYYFKYNRSSEKDPDIIEQIANYYSVQEAEQLGLIRNKREEFKLDLAERSKLEEIDHRQRQLKLAEEKLAIERERFEQEKQDKETTRKDNWLSARIKDVIDLAKLIIPVGVTLLTLYLKMKKSN